MHTCSKYTWALTSKNRYQGIFKGSRTCEAFFLKDRKALARWALKHGMQGRGGEGERERGEKGGGGVWGGVCDAQDVD
jgi:hypothetical protein